MRDEPIHEHFGISVSEWLSRLPNNLEIDDIAIWQIVPVGRESFGLSGNELADFTCKAIVSLLENGALPVRPSGNGDGWLPIKEYEGEPKQVAVRIVRDLELSKIDTYFDGLWFISTPSVQKTTHMTVIRQLIQKFLSLYKKWYYSKWWYK